MTTTKTLISVRPHTTGLSPAPHQKFNFISRGATSIILRNYSSDNSKDMSLFQKIIYKNKISHVELSQNIINHSDKFHFFVAISKFKYHRTHKNNRIYASVFFYNTFTHDNYISKDFFDNLDDNYFKNLVVIDVLTFNNKTSNISPFKTTRVKILNTGIEEFFTKDYLENITYSNYTRDGDTSIILHFTGIGWSTVKLAFKLYNIDIGGNNNTLKHILSPQQFLLSKFLMVYFDKSGSLVNSSFIQHSANKSLSRALYNFTFKYDKEILELIKKNNDKEMDEIKVREENYANSKISKSKAKSIINQKRSFHSSTRVSYNIYTELRSIIRNNPINMDTQLEIEKFLKKRGTAILPKQINGLYVGLYSKKVTKVLSKWKPYLIEKINKLLAQEEEYKKKNEFRASASKSRLHLIDFIKHTGKDFVIEILYGRFLLIISEIRNNPTDEEKNLSIRVALDLTKELIEEYFYKKFINHRAYLINNNKISNEKQYTFSDWRQENISLVKELDKDEDIKVTIGVILLEWLEDCNLLTKKLVNIDTKKYNKYVANPDVGEEIENELKAEILTTTNRSVPLIKDMPDLITPPIKLPSIVPPKAYELTEEGKVRLGGYLLNDELYADGVILPNHKLKIQSDIAKDNIIYDVLNNINSIPYKINTELYEFISNKSELFKESLYYRNHPLSKKGKLTSREKTELQRYNSKLIQQEHILKIAEVFSIITEFYFINRIDNRGRLYCVTEHLNYQSTELAKALLLFSRPSKIHRINSESSLLYFKAYGANCYGNKLDKASLKEKSDWVEGNSENILNYDNGVLISSSDNKFLFTAFCIEYKKWYDFYYNSSETFFETHLPIQLDASCNGFQHLVMLSGEENLRKPLNLVELSYYDKPYDFYSYVLEIYIHHLNSLDLSKFKPEVRESYMRIKSFCLDRKIIKKMIMTIPYNASNLTIVEDMKDLLKYYKDSEGNDWLIHPNDININPKILSYKDLFLLVTSIKDQIDIIAPRVKNLKDYLIKIAHICTDMNIHIPWKLPTGLIVKQSYLQEYSVNIKPFSFSKSKIKLSVYKDKLDLNKQTRAFMPNLIHSLDATALMLLVNNYLKNTELDNKNIYTIHDCFAMPMNHVEYVIDTLRKVYTSIYSEANYLEELNKGILDVIKLHYGNLEFDADNGDLIVLVDGVKKRYKYPDIKPLLNNKLKLDPGAYYLLI